MVRSCAPRPISYKAEISRGWRAGLNEDEQLPIADPMRQLGSAIGERNSCLGIEPDAQVVEADTRIVSLRGAQVESEVACIHEDAWEVHGVDLMTIDVSVIWLPNPRTPMRFAAPGPVSI